MSDLEVLRDWLENECNMEYNVEELKNLYTLDLSYDNLTQLPPEIGQLKNLTHLHLYRNKLTQIPIEIGQLKNLKLLGLSYNNLTQLPPEILNLKSLRCFSCNKVFVKESDTKMIKFLDKFKQKYQIIQDTLVTGVLI